MSAESKKGSDFEKKVAAMLRRADSLGSRNKGSHANWHRRSDVFTSLPIHIECKDHKTVKIKEWFMQADSARAANEAPVVVHSKDGEPLATLRFKDLLDLYIEINDLRKEVADLLAPVEAAMFTEPSILVCKAGHLADDRGRCLQKHCRYA